MRPAIRPNVEKAVLFETVGPSPSICEVDRLMALVCGR
jgi:hypothetical protein